MKKGLREAGKEICILLNLADSPFFKLLYPQCCRVFPYLTSMSPLLCLYPSSSRLSLLSDSIAKTFSISKERLILEETEFYVPLYDRSGTPAKCSLYPAHRWTLSVLFLQAKEGLEESDGSVEGNESWHFPGHVLDV